MAAVASVTVWLPVISGAQASRITPAFVDAVAQIESGGGRCTIGDGGKANGWWQMHEPAWQDTSAFRQRRSLPVWGYESAREPEVARLYARDYLTILENQLRGEFGDCTTPELIYAAYNVGFGRFQKLCFLIEKTPRRTQAACARLGPLIREFETQPDKPMEVARAE